MSEERRIVTVLFADVTGSTALGEELDPEELRALLGRYYAAAREVVAAHGGILEKFIGDAVMAVFGFERAFGDDAERALAAALELRSAVQSDPQLAGLGLRFGLSTGEVVASRDSSAGDFLVTGDPVNTAARLQQAAEPWQVLVSDRTARSVGAAFDLGPPRDLPARGKSAPIRAQAVIAQRRRTARRVAARMPLIGRDDELEQMRIAARRAFREKRPALVTIIAPAGAGKTRLLEEFVASALPAISPGARVAVANCVPYGRQLTYTPLRQLLFSLVGIGEDAVATEVLAAIREWAPDLETAELLAATLGESSIEAPDRTRLFSAWRAALEHATRDGPLVLVFEDLHWSSESLLDLIEFLLTPRAESALMVLALARPELLERRPAWGSGSRNYLSIFLEPLSRQEIGQLVHQLVDDPDGAISTKVMKRAGGNPFYAGELARAALEQGDDAALPDSVNAAILARLDGLPANCRRLVQLGSIYGRSFRPADITAISELDQAAVVQTCNELIERDILRRDREGKYRYRHILIREVAYQTLTRSERARLHAAAGAWIESSIAGREDPQAEIVALHYGRAVEAAGSRATEEIRHKARHWLQRASRVAIAGGANVEAARHLRAAIELAGPQRQAELYEILGTVEQLQRSAIEAYSHSLRLVRETGGSQESELKAIAGLLFTCMRWWAAGGVLSLEDVHQLREQGRLLIGTVSDEWVVARYLAADAFYPFYARHEGVSITDADIQDAENAATRAAEVAQRLDARNTWSAAIDALGACAIERGDWEEAREYARRRIAAGSRLSLLERLDAHAVAAWMSINLGELVEADRVTMVGKQLVDAGQEQGASLLLMGHRIYALALLGRWEEALDEGDHALATWAAIGRPPVMGLSFSICLDLARRRHDGRRALSYQEALEAVIAGSPMRPGLRPLLEDDLDAMRAQLTVREGPEWAGVIERSLTRILDCGERIPKEVVGALLHWAETWKMPIIELQCRRALGTEAELERAIRGFEAIGSASGGAVARCELALLRNDEVARAEALVDLELRGDLEYVERVESLLNV